MIKKGKYQIYMQCFACGRVYMLRVIRLLSNIKKGRLTVWCNNEFTLIH